MQQWRLTKAGVARVHELDAWATRAALAGAAMTEAAAARSIARIWGV